MCRSREGESPDVMPSQSQYSSRLLQYLHETAMKRRSRANDQVLKNCREVQGAVERTPSVGVPRDVGCRALVVYAQRG